MNPSITWSLLCVIIVAIIAIDGLSVKNKNEGQFIACARVKISPLTNTTTTNKPSSSITSSTTKRTSTPSSTTKRTSTTSTTTKRTSTTSSTTKRTSTTSTTKKTSTPSSTTISISISTNPSTPRSTSTFSNASNSTIAPTTKASNFSNPSALWSDFKVQLKTSYNASNDAVLKTNFMNTQTILQKINKKQFTFQLANNNFSIKTPLERAAFLGVNYTNISQLIVPTFHRNKTIPPGKNRSLERDFALPGWYDLRIDFCLGPIKNQLECLSSWAYSVLASAEYNLCLGRNGLYTALSEQYLIDCDTYDNGCNGGTPGGALTYLAQQGILPVLSRYPNTGMNGTCHPFGFSAGGILGFGPIGTLNVQAIMLSVIQKGPVSVVMKAVDSFYFYGGGVYNDPACNNLTYFNQAVNIVGWGTDRNAGDFWIVRNSWGLYWGMYGNFFIQRGNNLCGIETFPIWIESY